MGGEEERVRGGKRGEDLSGGEARIRGED